MKDWTQITLSNPVGDLLSWQKQIASTKLDPWVGEDLFEHVRREARKQFPEIHEITVDMDHMTKTRWMRVVVRRNDQFFLQRIRLDATIWVRLYSKDEQIALNVASQILDMIQRACKEIRQAGLWPPEYNLVSEMRISST